MNDNDIKDKIIDVLKRIEEGESIYESYEHYKIHVLTGKLPELILPEDIDFDEDSDECFEDIDFDILKYLD